MMLFSERTGLNISREELVRQAFTGEPNEIRKGRFDYFGEV